MAIYEVNLDVDSAVAAEYLVWLRAHIPEVLACDGFVDAELFQREPDAAAAGKVCWTVHYHVDRAALERYFERDAPRLRQDGLNRFGGKFTASRRILAAMEHFV